MTNILALDQGTTSSRAILYDSRGHEIRKAARPLNVSFPAAGWVEQDAEEIWSTQLAALKEAAAGEEASIAAIGITNQRETVVAWDRKSGKPAAPAIVWQCRRSADICDALRAEGVSESIRKETGLVIDPYFSATKIAWMLCNIAGLSDRVKRKEILFGTVDSWVLWKLTEGRETATDFTNASRTMLLSLGGKSWNAELLKMFDLSPDNLCEIRPSNAAFGTTSVLGRPIPIRSVIGDQQASLVGHGCFERDSAKCTFGTGAFFLVNTGEEIRRSGSGLLTTIAADYADGKRTFALEGSLFVAGSLIQWLRDQLHFVSSSEQSEALAEQCADSGGVILIPAFVGLGAPYWSERVRGAMFGLTRDTSPAHIARAALEAVAHQVADLFELSELKDVSVIAIDGGMTANSLFCRILADYCGRCVERPASSELTAKGAAALSALGVLFGGDIKTLREAYYSPQGGKLRYFPQSDSADARRRWKAAIQALLQTAGAV